MGSLDVETPAELVGKTIIAFVGAGGEAHLMLCPSAADVADFAEGKSDGHEEAAARLFGGWKSSANPVSPELLEAILRLGKGVARLVKGLRPKLLAINMPAPNACVAVDVLVAVASVHGGSLDWWPPAAGAAEANVSVCKLERSVEMAVFVRELGLKEAADAQGCKAAQRLAVRAGGKSRAAMELLHCTDSRWHKKKRRRRSWTPRGAWLQAPRRRTH